MKPIVLTPEQRREIERRCKETLDRRVYQRLAAVLVVAAGKTREEVAQGTRSRTGPAWIQEAGKWGREERRVDNEPTGLNLGVWGIGPDR